jgi:hypothetical protein
MAERERFLLDRVSGCGHRRRGKARSTEMASSARGKMAVLAALIATAGCSSTRTTACQCPKPIAYDDDTLTKISQALRALPEDNVLRQAMEDYENERDDLRFCPQP